MIHLCDFSACCMVRNTRFVRQQIYSFWLANGNALRALWYSCYPGNAIPLVAYSSKAL